MHDNNTVQQLSDALNELLTAYDKLKNENDILQEENNTNSNKIIELEAKNTSLEKQIEQLTDTTKKDTNKIDIMLGRIKTILDEAPEEREQKGTLEEQEKINSLDKKDTESSSTTSQSDSETIIQEQTIMDIEKEEEQSTSSSQKEINLGRMQSLLNGFNN